MVRRLVEQQEVRRRDERARQCDALALPAGQRAGPGVRIEREARQHRIDLRLEPPAIARFQYGMQFGHSHELLFDVALARRDRMRKRVVLDDRVTHLAEPLRRDLEHGGVLVHRGFLRDDRDAQARLAPDRAVVRLDRARQHTHQRRLAHPVAPDETEALAAVDHEIGVVQQGDVAVGVADASECEKRHGEFRERGVACGEGPAATGKTIVDRATAPRGSRSLSRFARTSDSPAPPLQSAPSRPGSSVDRAAPS